MHGNVGVGQGRALTRPVGKVRTGVRLDIAEEPMR